MKKIKLALTLVATIVFSIHPLYGVECQTNPNSYVAYFGDCGCQACAGWAVSNCTECWDGDGNYCQTTSSNGYCEPRIMEKW